MRLLLIHFLMMLSSSQEIASSLPTASSTTIVWRFASGFAEEHGKYVAKYLSDSTTRIQIGHVVIYRFHGLISLRENKVIENSRPFFVYDERDSVGINLENGADTSTDNRVAVRTLLSTHDGINYDAVWPVTDSFKQVMNTKYKTGLYSNIQKFVPAYSTHSATMPDSIAYYFSKPQSNGLWISREADSLTKSTLTKMVMYYKENLDQSQKQMVSAYTVSASIQHVSNLTPSADILSIYNWFCRIRRH